MDPLLVVTVFLLTTALIRGIWALRAVAYGDLGGARRSLRWTVTLGGIGVATLLTWVFFFSGETTATKIGMGGLVAVLCVGGFGIGLSIAGPRR